MARYVAFLRAINLAKHRRVAMADLREELTAIGYDDVSTYIASGNVLFTTTGTTATLEQSIEPRLATRFGFDIPTFVRTAAQVDRAVTLEPFGALADGDTWSVTFLRRAPSTSARQAVAALSNDVDTLEVHGADLHWHVRGGGRLGSTVKDTQLRAALDGIEGTNRNSTMLRKLLEKLY